MGDHTLFDTFAEQVPRVMFLPSVAVTVFALYVILTHSPTSLGRYKYVLIGMILASLQFDVTVSFLVQPNPLPGAVGALLVGVLAHLWPKEGVILCVIALSSFVFEFVYIVMTFVFREAIVTKDVEKSYHKYIRYFQIIVGILFFLSAAPLGLDVAAKEDEARLIMQRLNVSYCLECGLYVVKKFDTFVLIGLDTIAVLVLFTTFIYKSVHRINAFLTAQRNHMSGATVRMQRMLLRALMWQTAIPFLLMFVPGLLMLCVVYDVPQFEAALEASRLGQKICGIVFTLPSFFTMAHVLAMLYFTTPYRNFCLKRFRKPRSLTVIPLSSLGASGVSVSIANGSGYHAAPRLSIPANKN